MAQRKLGRTADQRKALLRNQVTNLIWYGRIETTEARAKEVRRAAERLITLAVNECDNTVEVTKETHNDKGQLVTLNVVNDAPSKLHARRLMMSYLYELKDVQRKDEDKAEMVGIARGFEEMGIEIYATSGTCDALTAAGIACKRVNRVSQSHPNILDMIQSGTVDLIINTPTKGRKHDSDGFKIRRCAVEHSVPCVTAVDTAHAMLTIREFSHSADLVPIDVTTI